jgi:hypothetical protein
MFSKIPKTKKCTPKHPKNRINQFLKSQVRRLLMKNSENRTWSKLKNIKNGIFEN